MDTTEGAAQARERYLAFAENEARGVSPAYDSLARGVAESDELLAFVASLPPAKRQPNLVFAAVRHLYGTPSDAAALATIIRKHEREVRALIMARGTQTNEPGRCAVLLPVLASLPQPLALVEVGASAGLCLLPDHYGYDYGRARLAPEPDEAAEPPVFPCRANGATPIPARLPEVAWRAGLDLNPVDLDDPEQTAWLRTLVWPGQDERTRRLGAAIEVARLHRPDVVHGDLLDDLPALAANAPTGATLVVFHSAVLAYVDGERRRRFASLVRELGAVWVSNEFPAVVPEVAARLTRPAPAGAFLLGMDGQPVAFTGPHGQFVEWLA